MRTTLLSQLNFGKFSMAKEWMNGNWITFYKYIELSAIIIIGLAFCLLFIFSFKLLGKQKERPIGNFLRVLQLFFFIGFISSVVFSLSSWFGFYETKILLLTAAAVMLFITVWGFMKIYTHLFDLVSPAQSEMNVMKRTAELAEMNNNLISRHVDLDNYYQAANRDITLSAKIIGEQIQLIKNELGAFSVTEKRKLRRIENEINTIESTVLTFNELINSIKNPYEDIEEVQIPELLLEIFKENEGLFRKYNPLLHEQLSEYTLIYSRSGLKCILNNLIINSLKYSSPERRAEVWLRSFISDGRFIIEVEDNGLGIDLKQYQNRLFKMFKRIYFHVEGSGIGLFSVKQLIERKGGSIEVESEPDRGSVFRVLI
jgi:signal transduction histidine kinase